MPRLRLLQAAAIAAAALIVSAAPPARAAFASEPPPPSDSTIVERLFSWRVTPESPCRDDSLAILIQWCPLCTTRLSATMTTAGLVIDADHPDGFCEVGAACALQSTRVPLGRFAAGDFTLHAQVVAHLQQSGGGERVVTMIRSLTFSVRRDCPPEDGPLPYVEVMRVTGVSGPDPCAGDSVRVAIRGRFPNDCYSLRRAELVHPVYPANVPPGPPIAVRLLVENGCCLGRPCGAAPAPFAVWLTTGELPAGDHVLPVELSEVCCADTFPVPPQHVTRVPYTVFPEDECRPSAGCLIPRLGRWDRTCDATIAPDRPAKLTLRIQTSVALAALEGVLRMSPKALRITHLAPVGPAAGMNLSWNATPDGARFVMFAERGAPIPVVPPDWFEAGGSPVLEATCEVRDGGMAPPVTYVVPDEFLGSDSLGHGVPLCMAPRTLVNDPRMDVSARICADQPCDANGDGRSDVRDLVLMVRCLHVACSDTMRFDCDGDGSFAFDDVVCCALSILRRHAPPDDHAVPPPPRLAARLESPVRDGREIRVPIRVSGADLLGAAMFSLRFPADRYDLVSVRALGDPGGVMVLHDAEGGEAALGFMNTISLGLADAGRGDAVASEPPPVSEVVLEATLALRAGAEPGGEIFLDDGQFATTGGERIAYTPPPSSQPVLAPARSALAPARPNPFSSETRFSIDLARAGMAELTVHDIGGRRVASLFRGALPAGRSEFGWNGRTDRGERAAEGVYFVRLLAPDGMVARKLVVLRKP